MQLPGTENLQHDNHNLKTIINSKRGTSWCLIHPAKHKIDAKKLTKSSQQKQWHQKRLVLREELENNIRIDNDIYKSRIQPELQSQNLRLAAGHLLKLKELFHPDRHKDVLRMPKSGRVTPN